jgi:hypothetical protein
MSHERPSPGCRPWHDSIVGLARYAGIAAMLPMLFAARPAAARAATPAADPGDREEVRFIDEQIAAGWADAGLRPSVPATAGEWCRRVHLDLIGRIPTVAELDAYLADSSPVKRATLVGRLLGSDHAEEYARHWTDVWATLLIGREADNTMVNRPGMRQWLRAALVANMPYDRFMRELVTAHGVNANRRGVAGFNGAANFLSGKLSDMGVENGVLATAKTAQIFLGVQVQCTQCHDHPFNKAKQNQFWELNSFFRQARALRRFDGGRDVGWVELVDEDFAGEGGDPSRAEVFYERRNGLMQIAYPVFLDGSTIAREGWLPNTMPDGTAYGVHRRRELARLIEGSPLFSQAVVNRIWARFFGHGFTRPIDDFGDHNPPSHPGLLDGLASRFREGGYDLKELMRWIVLSEPYQLSSRTTKQNAGDDPAMGGAVRFSRFYLRQLEAEQLYESLVTATRADRAVKGEQAARTKDEWLRQFVIAFGTDEGGEATIFNGSIPQVLMMFNGDLMRRATAVGGGGFLDQVAGSPMKNPEKITALYKAALARRPTAREKAAADRILDSRRGDVVGALQDVWWAILNSNEFILNH